MPIVSWIYTLAVLGAAVMGVNMTLLLVLGLIYQLPRPLASPPTVWPSVLVQLPIFNERYVIERLIDAAVALDYPADQLTIQVLDDSTDETSALARMRVAYHQARGRRVTYLHRTERTGFKAGALANGLTISPAEYVTVFDADFVPPPDFLRLTIPEFYADPQLGMVQARWSHLNADQNVLTRAQALILDGYFMIYQVARHRAGFLTNFNGSAGVWRTATIESAGGWQGDTLAEDLDLSYRAQLKGWRMSYLPQVTAPAELPVSILAFKRQQARWATGSFQVLRKLGPDLLQARLPLMSKIQGLFQLAGYLPFPLMFISMIGSLPMVLLHQHAPLNWGWLSLISLGLDILLGQVLLYKDWPKRLLSFPVLFMVGIGLTLTNTVATWEAFFGRNHKFIRTPKFSSLNQRETTYILPVDWTTWGELLLALYAFATGFVALERVPTMAPFIFIQAIGFGFTAALGFWQSGGLTRPAKSPESA